MARARTDRHNNPTAFTVAIARQAGLSEGIDFSVGDPFDGGGSESLTTARLIGDPIAITIRVINRIGFYTKSGHQRWQYIGIPDFIWIALMPRQRQDVILFMYHHEGGSELNSLFA